MLVTNTINWWPKWNLFLFYLWVPTQCLDLITEVQWSSSLSFGHRPTQISHIGAVRRVCCTCVQASSLSWGGGVGAGAGIPPSGTAISVVSWTAWRWLISNSWGFCASAESMFTHISNSLSEQEPPSKIGKGNVIRVTQQLSRCVCVCVGVCAWLLHCKSESFTRKISA